MLHASSFGPDSPSFSRLSLGQLTTKLPSAAARTLVAILRSTSHRKEISENMKDFGSFEQIRKFTLLDAEWSQDTGELTPTFP